jgi:DNA-binding transcriptional LysR family regulator
MDRLEARELAYFVAVAEELHFGRAAQRLGMAQPPLSRAISRLERRIGVRLLDRTSRRVSLSPAGEVFLAESRKALDAIDAATHRAQQASGCHRLTLAVRPGAGSDILPGLLDAYRLRPGAAPVEVVFSHDQATALRNGTADIAVMCSSDDLTGLHTIELVAENPVVLLPVGHHLARRPHVTLAEVRRQKAFQEACPATSLDEIIDLVALGRLIVVVGDGTVNRLGSTVAAVPVPDLPATRLLLAWPQLIPTPQLRALLDTAITITDRRVRQVRRSMVRSHVDSPGSEALAR